METSELCVKSIQIYEKRSQNDIGMNAYTFAYYKMVGLNYLTAELKFHTSHLAEFFRLFNVTRVKMHLQKAVTLYHILL